MKLKHVLQMYFEVCFYDLNGANNVGGMNNPELLKQFPPFNPKDAFLAPAIIDSIQRIMRKLNISNDEARTIFVEYNSHIGKNLCLPLSPEEGWGSLDKELGE